MNNKRDQFILDAHIDISDNVLYGGKDFFKEGKFHQKQGLLNQADFWRLKSSHIKIFFGSICPFIFTPKGIVKPKDMTKEVIKHMNVYLKIAKQSSGKIIVIKNKKDLKQIIKNQKIGVVLHLEGANFIKKSEDLFLLDVFFDLGGRSIGPFWEIDNNLGTAGRAKNKKAGLSSLGIAFLEKAIKMGFIIDLAHASNQSLEEMLQMNIKRLTFSHGGCQKISKNKRDLTDNQIRQIINSGGMLGISFLSPPKDNNRNKEIIVLQMKHILELKGEDNMGIGSDFEGMTREDVIPGLEDITKIKKIGKMLLGQNVSRKVVNKIMFKNFFRFLERALPQ